MLKLLFLDRVSDATVLSEACRGELLQCVSVHEAKDETRLPDTHQLDSRLLLIVSGIARVYAVTDDGKDVTQYFARAEDFIAANPAHGDNRTLQVEAITELSYVSLRTEDFDRLLVTYPEMGVFLAAYMRDASLRAREREARRGRAEAVDSYASFLLAYPGLETQVPTVHLASYLGLTPSQFMRARQKYRERGIM